MLRRPRPAPKKSRANSPFAVLVLVPHVSRPKRDITGVLLLDKPLGLSSNAALTRAKILFEAAKAGHTGTLDPAASGLLPVCFGEATKYAGYLLNAGKTYEAVIQLGVTTSTGDAEGEVLSRQAVAVTPEAVQGALSRFTGPITQIPPMHSALKCQGRRLYELARAGLEVTRAPRQVTIYALNLTELNGDLLTIRAACSKGTYIRVLAEDIGQALGCGAHLAALRRTRVADFDLVAAIGLEDLGELPLAQRGARLLAPDCLLGHLPRLDVSGEEAIRLLHGNWVDAPALAAAGEVRLYGTAGEFLGVGALEPGRQLTPRRMMSSQDTVPTMGPDAEHISG